MKTIWEWNLEPYGATVLSLPKKNGSAIGPITERPICFVGYLHRNAVG